MPMQATRTVHKRLGIIFDFDDTLAPDSFRSLLASYGLEKERFEQEQIAPLLADGWDEILAKMYCLVQLSQQHPDDPITWTPGSGWTIWPGPTTTRNRS